MSTMIWLDEVACTSGSDVSLVQCRHEEFGIHNCDHSQDIALRCSSSNSFFGGCKCSWIAKYGCAFADSVVILGTHQSQQKSFLNSNFVMW